MYETILNSIKPVLVLVIIQTTCFISTTLGKSNADTTTTPDLKLTDAYGKTITISALKGKVVFINFWATWCQPCIQEMPTIQALKESFKDNDSIVFLTVDIDGDLPKSNAYMEKKKYSLPVYAAPTAVPREYYYHTIPATDILGKYGDIIWRVDGGFDYSSPEVRKILTDLIESK
ncbi:TlpA disulfide reductase family protein [Chitinophaga sp.]|uniref:TlpA family protein disulfide reductase n=1 Tax=Chitinophaga sp. TaxID=1869181 RepID=UPI0031DFE85B